MEIKIVQTIPADGGGDDGYADGYVDGWKLSDGEH